MMNDGRLTAWIGGREALPVRAIPYVTGWRNFPPDEVVACLAQSESIARISTLTAYHIPGKTPIQVKPREWDAEMVKLKGLEANLRREHGSDDNGGDIGYAAWQAEAVVKLPAGVFIWLDEFEKEYQAKVNHWTFIYHEPPHDSDIADELLVDTELTLTPKLDIVTRAMVMEGFETRPIMVNEQELVQANQTDPTADDVGTIAQAEGEQDEKHGDDGEDSEQGAHDKAALAALFDPVTPAALEKMFPADGKWARWHSKAKEKGLDKARDGRGKYNPYFAALWWLDTQAPDGWTLGQCLKRLANNLPPRSHGLESRLTGKNEGEI